MPTEVQKSFILDYDNKRWFIYLNANQHIIFTCRTSGIWTEHRAVSSQSVKDFAAAVDSGGNLHILAYTHTRQLIYYEWDGQKWNFKLMDRIYSRFQNISYLTIFFTGDIIHIMYYIESSLRRSTESLMHYFKLDRGWKGGLVWKCISDDMFLPQSICTDTEKRVHFLFTKHPQREFKLYYSLYNPEVLSWTQPLVIHNSKHEYKNCHIHNEQSGHMHVLWKEESEGQYSIKYIGKYDNTAIDSWTDEKVIYQGPKEPLLPLLVSTEKLYCLWNSGGHLYCRASDDHGISWGKTEDIKGFATENTVYHYFQWCGNKKTCSCTGIWGKGYPDTDLPIIDFSPEKQEIRQNPSQVTNKAGEDKRLDFLLSAVKKQSIEYGEQFSKLAKQIQELYAAIYELEDQQVQKEKTLYQMQSQLKGLSFELKQMQHILGKKAGTVSHQRNDVPGVGDMDSKDMESKDKKDKKNDTMPEKLTGDKPTPEKITLGNTTILINPGEEQVE